MGLEFWANISVVWLALLCFVGMLIPVVVAYYAIRAMHVALGKSRSAMGTAQIYSSKIRAGTESVSQKIAQPVVRAGTKAAEAEEIVRSLTDDSRA